jgi:hypothetical protein
LGAQRRGFGGAAPTAPTARSALPLTGVVSDAGRDVESSHREIDGGAQLPANPLPEAPTTQRKHRTIHATIHNIHIALCAIAAQHSVACRHEHDSSENRTDRTKTVSSE